MAINEGLTIDTFAKYSKRDAAELRNGIPDAVPYLLTQWTKISRFTQSLLPGDPPAMPIHLGSPWWFLHEDLLSWWRYLRSAGDGVEAMIKRLRLRGWYGLELWRSDKNDAALLDTVTVLQDVWVFSSPRADPVRQLYLAKLATRGSLTNQGLDVLGFPSVVRLV